MTITEKTIHHLLLALVFSFINWFIINKLVTPLPFITYFIIEIILAISLKIFKFTIQKLNLS